MSNNKNDTPFLGYSILYEQEITKNYIFDNFDEVIVAIGNNSSRLDKINYYLDVGIKVATIIHPKTIISRFAKIGIGTIISENTIIGPFVTLGKGCRIGPNGIVCHECNLSDGVNLSPKATMGGGCNIGEKTWLCIGSTLSDHITIGNNCVVGAGAVVLKDMPDNALIIGMPAFIKKYYDKIKSKKRRITGLFTLCPR
jgi:sugar O-acyltransferase (sialic acid O-acetyltransferase NeuD family)